jgi:hypothetical protein
MLGRYVALLFVCTPLSLYAQEADLFSCVEASRLTTRTATYAVTGSSANYSDVEEIVADQVGDRALLRITRTRSRDGVMTAAQILHVDARTLVPVAFVHNSARTPDKPVAELMVRGGRLTGRSYGDHAIDVATSGEPVFLAVQPTT